MPTRFVMRRTSEPSRFIVYSSRSPSRVLVNTIRSPFGEIVASGPSVAVGYWKDPDSLSVSGPDTLVPKRAATTAKAAASDFITPTISARAIDVYVKAALAADPVRTDWRRMEEYNALSPAKLTVPTLLMVGAQVPAKSLKELIAMAKGQPGKLNFASTNGNASSSHIAGELFKKKT